MRSRVKPKLTFRNRTRALALVLVLGAVGAGVARFIRWERESLRVRQVASTRPEACPYKFANVYYAQAQDASGTRAANTVAREFEEAITLKRAEEVFDEKGLSTVRARYAEELAELESEIRQDVTEMIYLFYKYPELLNALNPREVHLATRKILAQMKRGACHV